VLGLSRTSVAHAAIFANLSPFLVLLLASASGLEKLTPRKIFGVAVVALGGVILLRVVDAAPRGQSTFLGDFFTFLGSLAFAIFTVLGKPTAKPNGSIPVNTVAYVGGAAASGAGDHLASGTLPSGDSAVVRRGSRYFIWRWDRR
jgi:drug/metabolite transporter (DMT)-like permease